MRIILEYNEWVTTTYQPVDINEGWDISEWSHILVDVTSAIADTVAPGSGAIIDLIHAISYFIEAKTNNDKIEKMSLQLQGLVTIGSVVAIGSLQAIAVAFKTEIKTIANAFKAGANAATFNLAKKAATSATAHAKQILTLVKDMANWVGRKIVELKNTELGTWLLSKFGNLNSAVAEVTNYITVTIPNTITTFLQLIAKLNPTNIAANAGTGETSELAFKQLAKAYASNQFSSLGLNVITNNFNNTNTQITQLTNTTKQKKI